MLVKQVLFLVMYVCMSVCVCVCLYVRLYVCLCVCLCVCVFVQELKNYLSEKFMSLTPNMYYCVR